MKQGREFLKKKYDLHKTPEVESAARRTEKRTKEKLPQAPGERIQNYLDRFKEIVERKDPEKRERGMEALKQVLHDKFVIKPEQIPESYFELQKKIAREQGHGDIEITKELKEQAGEVIITDQRTTLDNWVDYLSSSDATYPDWLKYWTMRSVLSMGDYDKEKKSFTKRSKDTVKPFPDINREALAYVLDAVSKKYGKQHIELLALNEAEKKEFEQLLQGENFGKLYAWALEKTAVPPQEGLENTRGKWVRYPQNSDHLPLVESLQGHGTNWCTAGESTAQAQLKGGDFYVYYSLDKQGKPTIPRAAIRMQGNQIAEVRGIAKEQNLDPQIGGVVQEKLKEFPDGPKYEKRVGDMKQLTEIEQKTKNNQLLTKEELLFLYEADSKIEGFGYQRDPRIQELRDQRNPAEDMLVIFECTKDQIAHNSKEINQSTKVYLGKLEPGIFTKLQEYDIEHIYTSFPEGRIRIEKDFEVEPLTFKEFKKRAEAYNSTVADESLKIKASDYAEFMAKSKDFASLERKKQLDLIRLSVNDLFSDGRGHTTSEIYQKAQELGLELCPAEVGPLKRLQDKDQPMKDWYYIAMKQISDPDGNPYVFELVRDGSGLWLSSYWAYPDDKWNPHNQFVFSLRKLETKKL